MPDRLKINGNDLELDGNKVGRLFDITTFQRRDLLELFNKANDFDLEMELERERNKND